MKIVNRYIGVFGGYLGDFTYRTHADFYSEYCDLDINPNQYEGTTRQRFIAIISGQEPWAQARIIRGVVDRFPIAGPDSPPTRTEEFRGELLRWADRLHGIVVNSTAPQTSRADVFQAIADTETLLRSHSGAPVSVDRVHTTLHAYDQDIDAYSAVAGKLPVIVLDGGKGSVWDRDNFNLAHELGHIVMHRGIRHTPGTRTVEAQAHRFAGAFLGPAKAMREVLPRDLDWSRYFELKREWGMSMAALIRRARDLGVIDDATYTRAMKQRSAYGWRKAEPGSADRSLPAPRFLRQAMAKAEISSSRLAERAHLPEDVVLRIVGKPKPSLIH